MRLTCTYLMLLVYTACTILLAGISLLPHRNRMVWSLKLSGEVKFVQEVVGERMVVGLDWVKQDEGVMAWWRVLQMGDKIVRRPSKEGFLWLETLVILLSHRLKH
jgi:hypothetical protein